MSNTTKVRFSLFLIPLNHLMTEEEFCHWFTFIFSRTFEFILCNVDRLIFPSSLFVGFSNLYFGLVRKSSLWSLTVTKHFCGAITSVLSATANFVASFFASLFIALGTSWFAFLVIYVSLLGLCLYFFFLDLYIHRKVQELLFRDVSSISYFSRTHTDVFFMEPKIFLSLFIYKCNYPHHVLLYYSYSLPW